MLKQTDNGWTQGEYINFSDEGRVNPTSKSHVFSVYSRGNNSLLGNIRWYSQWRRYCYFTIDCILDAKCLREIAEFCETKTEEHKLKYAWKDTVPPKRKYDGRCK